MDSTTRRRSLSLFKIVAILFITASVAFSGTGKYARKSEKRARKKGLPLEKTDPRLTTYRYINDRTEYGGLTMTVGSDLARIRADSAYVPFVVSLLWEEEGRLEVRADSFTLEDEEKKIYQSIPRGKLLEKKDFALEMLSNERLYRTMEPPPGFHFLGRYVLRETRFYQPPSIGLPIESAELGGGTFFHDYVYFENPGRIEQQILKLTYKDHKSGRSIPVKFRIYPPKMYKKMQKK